MPFSSLLSSLLKQETTPVVPPWSIATATIPANISITRAVDIRFDITGNFAYVLVRDSTAVNERLRVYTCGAPFDATALTFSSASNTTGSGRPFSCCGVLHDTLHPNYGKLAYSTNDNTQILQYTSATPFGTLTNNGVVATITGLSSSRISYSDFYDNGNKFVIIGDGGMYVWNVSNYVLSGTYDTSTAIYGDPIIQTTLGYASGRINHLTWVGNGKFCYTLGSINNEIRLFNTSSAPYDYTAVNNTNFIETKSFGLSGSEYSLEFNRTTTPAQNDVGTFHIGNLVFKFIFS